MFRFNRENGEMPLQPPLLYVRTNLYYPLARKLGRKEEDDARVRRPAY